jgi:hypothetical protein
VARYCDLSRCGDHEEVLRNREPDAMCGLPDVACAQACRKYASAYQKCASAYRMNELLDDRFVQGVMCALAYRMYVLVELGVLLSDALDAHYALKQTLLHVTLASRPW